ncbi:MAG TPA: BamA/TamA family outer membrane protein [Stellaceae bacterium]|nr:BamA/TamA family outer membrane protein [Stellaceae bacterium]
MLRTSLSGSLISLRRWVFVAALAVGCCCSGLSAHADLSYETTITEVDDSDLGDLLDKVSNLKTLEDRKPASEEVLRRRADQDMARLTDAAHSQGYWDAHFSYEVDTSGDPAKVTVTATPGPQYHVASITVLGPGGKPLTVPLDPEEPAPLKPGDPALSAAVVGYEQALLSALGHTGHPFAKAADRHVVVDHAARTMAITYLIDPGPAMQFDGVAIAGLERLDPAYVERRLRWRQGETFDNRKVNETRDALAASGLFSTVKITPVADPATPDRVRMNVEAVERAHRTIGAGLGYNTSEGAGARLFWENRNLFGDAEYLRLSLAAGQQQNSLVANFRRPDFLAVDQDLLARAEIADETPVAYHSRRAHLSLGLERRFDRYLTGSIGLSVEKANVVEEAHVSTNTAGQRTQRYALVGVPLNLKLDKSDDLLNPTRGYRVQGSVVPYRSFSGPSLTFVSGRLAGSAYRRLTESDRYVLAASLAISSVAGESLVDLPADKRLYAGGGGSLRAYGYQMAGPLDINNRPIGGKSSAELSLELRIKITDTIGIVPFVDAGSVYKTSLPQLGHRLLWGPGLGLRYYTPIGPIRLDVATPALRRRGDSPIQLYISLGQAF